MGMKIFAFATSITLGVLFAVYAVVTAADPLSGFWRIVLYGGAGIFIGFVVYVILFDAFKNALPRFFLISLFKSILAAAIILPIPIFIFVGSRSLFGYDDIRLTVPIIGLLFIVAVIIGIYTVFNPLDKN